MRDIKDYLHLYYEGKVFAKFNDGSSGEMDLNVYYLRYPDIDPLPIEFKLILRPLSDMTEEEMILQENLFRTFVPDFKATNKQRQDALSRVKTKGMAAIVFDEENKPEMVFEVTRLYLSLGFDLFNLIPEGLAIDKTKLDNPTGYKK